MMKAKIIKNYDLKQKEDCFGIAFQVKKGAQYCKYLIGLQSLKTKNEAEAELKKVNEKLNALTDKQIAFLNSYPINKHQYVKL